MTDNRDRLSRRRFVEATSVATMLGLAGCSGNGGGDGGGGDGGGGDGGDGGGGGGGTPTRNGDPLDVLHGWNGGDGATAAEHLVSTFKDQYPDMNTNFETIGGGGNQNLDAVVANRLQANNPPSSFANWPGKNLQRYEGALGNVDEVWEENGFEDTMVDEAIELHKLNGHYRAVPLGSHRLNCLFYNVSVVEEAGVDPDSLTGVDALLSALDTVKSETNKTPMTQAMSGTWTTTQLWGSLLLGGEGYQTYMDFVNGDPNRDAVQRTFERLGEILQNYISDDASSLNLTASNNNIIQGNAAFIHQGNWAAGAFRNADNFDYNEDWGFKTFPGSEGMYTLHFDSFLYPSNNPTPVKSKTWEGFVGSTDAQIAFNQYKGSIPPRSDADMSEFGPYLQETAEDFRNADHRPPTIQHGLALVSEKMTSLNEAISNHFTGPYDVQAATDAFVSTVSN